MLHRAVLGSLERFLSVYIEHTAGWFPVWLAPEQVVLVTVSDKHLEYAEVARRRAPRSRACAPEVDPSNDKLTARRSAPPRSCARRTSAVIGDKEVLNEESLILHVDATIRSAPTATWTSNPNQPANPRPGGARHRR
jgi:threonyl-tRNA synthetase